MISYATPIGNQRKHICSALSSTDHQGHYPSENEETQKHNKPYNNIPNAGVTLLLTISTDLYHWSGPRPWDQKQHKPTDSRGPADGPSFGIGLFFATYAGALRPTPLL